MQRGETFSSRPLTLARIAQRITSAAGIGNIRKLDWQPCMPCPGKRTEATGVKIDNRFLLIGGYQSLDRVLSVIDVFDFEIQRWVDQLMMPAGMPQTHIAAACEDHRFVYFAGGQLGPRCHPATAECFVLDLQARSWNKIPPLPEPRYAPVLQLWQGRLHLVSGAKPDRWTSACDHWSITVSGGVAKENSWRVEATPIPKGGPHRAGGSWDDKLFVFGGQDGDLKPMRDDPCYGCDQTTPLETLYGDCFALQLGANSWVPVSAMPVPQTHSEAIPIGRYAIMAGGNHGRRCLSDLIQVYDTQSDRWRIAGLLPCCVKTTVAYHQGWLYLFSGQRNKGWFDLAPGEILNTVWRARFDPQVN